MNAIRLTLIACLFMFIPGTGGANDVFMQKNKKCACPPQKVVPAVFVVYQTKKKPIGFLI